MSHGLSPLKAKDSDIGLANSRNHLSTSLLVPSFPFLSKGSVLGLFTLLG